LETHLDVISRLSADIDRILDPLVTGDEPFSLLDFPDHANVGDSAIWLGNLAYFDKRGLAPSFVCRMPFIDAEQIRQRPTIFLHGGGNFGDVWSNDYWPNCQAFREAVIERFPEHRIVQLPQSIHYQHASSIERTARIIAGHRRFTLLVRDVESLEFAKRHFECETFLCPDMAFALGPMKRPHPSASGTLFLLRTDLERARNPAALSTRLPPNSTVTDWISESRSTKWVALVEALLMGGARSLSEPRHELKERYYRQKARLRVARGARLLSRHQAVVSDRLHVHIICTLLGIDHVMLDNNYGKIGRFMDAFSTRWSGARRATSIETALIELREPSAVPA
jgi:exopolysaccharide biosynthesis predicted pyruvyltransferase EpsI